MSVIESHTPYVDFTYYQQAFHGTMEETAFERALIEAEAFIDTITFGRIARLDAIPDAVKNAVCAVAEEINRREESRETAGAKKGVKSESNHNVSVTYADVISDEECRRNMLSEARMYLSGTGLLYRGFSRQYDGHCAKGGP